MSLFHSHDDWWFERQTNGDVHIIHGIRKEQRWEEIYDEVVLDKNTWCSIIASMSYYGEEDYGYFRACNFHYKEPIDPVTTPLQDKPNCFCE